MYYKIVSPSEPHLKAEIEVRTTKNGPIVSRVKFSENGLKLENTDEYSNMPAPFFRQILIASRKLLKQFLQE